ncbi:MAG: glycosyltransferase, partial [Gemmatimonadetes bacterium]|nr:glycosyltransferase [Gemmatimonadota bacterium]
PLEAMTCGAPVLCSRVGGLPEGVGNAAVMVAPTDADRFRGELTKLARSAELRDELRHKGFERVKRFSWESTARQTVALYEEVVRR